jgi:hypothetical protein
MDDVSLGPLCRHWHHQGMIPELLISLLLFFPLSLPYTKRKTTTTTRNQVCIGFSTGRLTHLERLKNIFIMHRDSHAWSADDGKLCPIPFHATPKPYPPHRTARVAKLQGSLSPKFPKLSPTHAGASYHSFRMITPSSSSLSLKSDTDRLRTIAKSSKVHLILRAFSPISLPRMRETSHHSFRTITQSSFFI